MPVIYLCGPSQRAYAAEALRRAPDNATVSIKAPRRTIEQNDKMWAMLHDIARAKPDGREWVPDTWKGAFMHLLGHQCMFAEGLDGTGPFPVGFRTSKMSVPQMRDLIELMYEYGARHNIEWRETKRAGFMS